MLCTLYHFSASRRPCSFMFIYKARLLILQHIIRGRLEVLLPFDPQIEEKQQPSKLL